MKILEFIKQRGFKIIKIILILVLIAFGLLNTTFYISRQTWKYNRGYYKGDFLTDYKATTDLNFCFGNFLIILNVEKFETGLYMNKM